MTSKTTQAELRHAAPIARLLAFLLLAFIVHTSTVDVAHRHANLSPATTSNAASFDDTGTNDSTDSGLRSAGQCLVCQLHQHLFSTLLINLPGLEPPPSEEAYASKTFTPLSSETRATRRGRAPPQLSLL